MVTNSKQFFCKNSPSADADYAFNGSTWQRIPAKILEESE